MASEFIEVSLDPTQLPVEEMYLAKAVQAHRHNGPWIIRKKTIDARRRVMIKYRLELSDEPLSHQVHHFSPAKELKGEVHIIGAGPAGYFAALRLLELGVKPVLFERGKEVRERRRDLADLMKKGVVNPESNYCYGEGGAGTFSDGKLYTRSLKRGKVQKVLDFFHEFGAKEEILYEAHPHIGTNKLPAIIEKMKETIKEHGGEIHFDSKLENFIVENGELKGLVINGETVPSTKCILATGHSARDIFHMVHDLGLEIESKPFALGVRIEHPQEVIDKMQYGNCPGMENLPPASYRLITQVKDRGVYSFCMCPGGIVAPCATEEGEAVTNGWSPSKRNNPFANSGIVVEVRPEDIGDPKDPFCCLKFQKEVERTCFEAGGGDMKVPAQRLMDFIEGRVSEDLPPSSYHPGLTSAPLHEILPKEVSRKLRTAFGTFSKKLAGYGTNDAVVHAPESRTSSPIRIPRDRETMQHPQCKGLFPCGEGAGFAGGIASAAIDGMRCADAAAE